MGPIDFSKFTAIKNEYLAFYDVCDLSAKLASLETKFPNFKKYINYFNDKTKLENIITADNVELLKLKKVVYLKKIIKMLLYIKKKKIN